MNTGPRELCLTHCGDLKREELHKGEDIYLGAAKDINTMADIHIYMADSFCCVVERQH